ncbi:MAG: hypothetical protein ACLRVQ_03260 [Lachnospiraceae bacterium]
MKNKNNSNKEKKKLSGFKKFLIIYPSVLVAVSAVLLFLLYGLLKDYEASEPNNTMEEIAKEFTKDNVGELLEEADITLTEFETKEVLKEYIADKIDGKAITYKRKSGEFTSAKPVYSVMADDEEIAKVTLAQKGKNSHNFTEWKLGDITFTDTDEDKLKVTISAPAGADVLINGVNVSDSYKSGEDIVVEETKNLEEFGAVFYNRKYDVTGLIKEPVITASLNGTELSVQKTEEGYVIEYPKDEELLASQTDYITEIFENYGKYIINRGNLSKLLSYTTGKAYTYLSDIPAVWAYLWGKEYTYEFRNESVTNLVKYSDTCFSVDVYFDLYVDYKTGNTTYNTSMTYTFVNDGGTWYLADFIQHQAESEDN